MNVSRLISTTLKDFMPKVYTATQVISKLESEIKMLERWFITGNFNSSAWQEKQALLKIKRENLDQVKRENNIQ